MLFPPMTEEYKKKGERIGDICSSLRVFLLPLASLTGGFFGGGRGMFWSSAFLHLQMQVCGSFQSLGPQNLSPLSGRAAIVVNFKGGDF